MNNPSAEAEVSDEGLMDTQTQIIRALSFLDGAADHDALLTHQILEPIKTALTAQVPWRNGMRGEDYAEDAVRVSLFPNVAGEILLMFDLADRNHFRQFSPEGRPHVSNFRKILVPGQWHRRQLLEDRSLSLTEGQVEVGGAPRVDFLRALAANQPARASSDGLTILVAPLHSNWADRSGAQMSIRPQIEPLLESLNSRFKVILAEDQRNRETKQPITQELLDADIVISDYTSVIYEAWSLGKPVIFPRWLTGDRILEKAPKCAEARIYRDRIGHHAGSFEELLTLLGKGRDLDLGPGVDAFMAEYLDNWQGKSAAETIAGILERFADKEREQRERDARQLLAVAVKGGKWAEAEAPLEQLLRWNAKDVGLYDLFAQAMNQQAKWWQERDALEHAIALSPEHAGRQTRLGDALMRLGQNRAAAEAFGRAIAQNPEKASASLHYKLGYALETQGHDGPPDGPRAAEAYKAACKADPKSAAATLGEGALHATAGRWAEAQRAYRTRLAEDPLNADLHHRLGVAHDRSYEWAQAEASYMRALALDPSKSAWHYSLGFVRERQEKFDAAAAAYGHAAALSKTHQPKWFYRAGYVLEKAGRLDEACRSFLKVQPNAAPPEPAQTYLDSFRAEHEHLAELARSQLALRPHDPALLATYSRLAEASGDLSAASEAASQVLIRAANPPEAFAKKASSMESKLRSLRLIEARLDIDCTRPQEWLTYCSVLTAQGRLAEAIEALQQALLRTSVHKPEWHHRLGLLLMQAGRLPEACAAFRDQMILQRPHGLSEDEFTKNADLREVATYREFYDVLPLMPQTILYESFGGEGCSDNPLAIFNQVNRDARFKGWRHVWVVEDLAKAPAELRNRRDVVFVIKETLQYQRLLCTVPWLVNNATFPFYFVRKDGQEYLNTWHGTPLKTLGYDIEATPLQRANTARNLIQASMFIAPNAHTEHVMMDRYGVRNLFTGRSLLTGYPRIDMLVNADEAEKTRIRSLLGLDPTKPVVLFAPTYRGHWATPELEAQSLAATLERMKSPDYNLVFRGHYFAERFIMEMNLPVTIAPHAIDTCSLLSIVDVLVSDYSSIFYDFLITRRPVIQFVPDWDDYAQTRGVYFGKDQVPGIICETEDHLLEVLADCIRDPKGQISQQYLEDLDRYCALEDGHASERVIEAFFFNPTPPLQPEHAPGARHILVHGGDLADGAQLSALRGLLEQIKHSGHVATLAVDRRVVINDEMRMANARSLLDRADVIIRFGKACFSLEESWVNDRITKPNYRPGPAMQAVFEASLRHEARRLFGHVHFDAVLEFDAKRPFWGNILSVLPKAEGFIRLPGDMVATMKQSAPGLERVIHALPRFDRLLSETQDLRDKNIAELQGASLSADRFGVLPVCVSAGDVAAELAKAPKDRVTQQFLARKDTRLLGIPGNDALAARQMIAAFAEVADFRPDVCLGLLCAPDAFVMLNRVIADHRLSDRISLLPDTQGYLFVMQACAGVILAQGAAFGAQIAAEARQIGTLALCLDTSAIQAEQWADLLLASEAGEAPKPLPNDIDALGALLASPKAAVSDRRH